MTNTFSRIRAAEESRLGLVIISALYGKLAGISGPADDQLHSSEEVIDVTIPVQCLVKDSKLVIYESSKVYSIFNHILFL